MNVFSRGLRNAFRNKVRMVSIVSIVGLSIGLALAMMVARQAVAAKIVAVKTSIGNTVSISPAGARGFEGGGNPLTVDQAGQLAKLAHVTAVTQTLADRLTSQDTSLQSAVDAGALGRRFSQNNGTGFSGGELQRPPQTRRSGAEDGTTVTPVMRTFTPPVQVTGTSNPRQPGQGAKLTLASGKLFAADSSDNVALVGSSLATKNNLKVGSTFTAYGQTITVVGTFDSGSTFGNNQIYMPLKSLQALSGQAGQLTAVTLDVDSVDNVAGVAAAAKSALGGAADVTNDSEQAATTIAPLQSIRTVTLYSLVAAVAAGAAIILLTMVMIVRERRKEIGVLKAVGASNLKVVLQFASEAVAFTALGAVLGIVVGAAASKPVTKLLVSNAVSSALPAGGFAAGRPTAAGAGRALARLGSSSNLTGVTATVGWGIILYGLAAAVLLAIVGSALASFFIAKVRPAEVMRTE